MRRNQLLAGIMTAMTVVMPVANVYADSAKDHEVQIAASIMVRKRSKKCIHIGSLQM